MIRVGAGEAVVHICTDVPPFGIGLDHVPVIILLELNGNHLINIVCGNTTISGNTQDPIITDRRA